MNEWVTVMTFTYPQDSYVIQGALESGGIETFLKDELTIQTDNFLSNAIGGVQLQVPKQQADRAVEILKSNGYFDKQKPSKISSNKIVILHGKDHNKSSCPFCKSENIGRVKRPRFITVLLILIIYSPFPFFRRNHYCYDCEKEWKYRN